MSWYGLHLAVLEEKRWKKWGKQILCRHLMCKVRTKTKPLNVHGHKHELKQIHLLKMSKVWGVSTLLGIRKNLEKFDWKKTLYKQRVWMCVHIYVHMYTHTSPLQLSLRCNVLCGCRKKHDLQGVLFLQMKSVGECVLNEGLSTYN